MLLSAAAGCRYDPFHVFLHRSVWRRRLVRPVAACFLIVIASCLASCASSDTQVPAATAATTSLRKVPNRIVDAGRVSSAPVLVKGKDYLVVADPPLTVEGRTANYLGLVGPDVVFGKTSVVPANVQDPNSFVGDSVIMTDLKTKKTTFITRNTDRKKQSYVIGMDYSDKYVTWSETTSQSASSEPWTVYSLERSTGEVRRIASSDEVGVSDPPWLPPSGVTPKIYEEYVYLIAADSNNLPATASAYRVPLDGSKKLSKVIGNVQGVFTFANGVTFIRNGQFFRWNPSNKAESKVNTLNRSSANCPGTSGGGVIVECGQSATGTSRLTIIESDRNVSEIDFPKSDETSDNAGVGYLGANANWVTFTFDDKAYAFNLKSGKLGRFKGSQYIVAGPSWGNTIRYAELWKSPTDVKPAPFIELK